MDRETLRIEALARIKELSVGDPVVNICAGEGNPLKQTKFVRVNRKSYTNRWGIKHSDTYAQCVDEKGRLHNTDPMVIVPASMPKEEQKALWDKTHRALFPDSYK